MDSLIRQMIDFKRGRVEDLGFRVEWKRLGEVSNIYDSLHQTPEYSDTGYSMVRVADIKGGYVDLDKTLKVSSTTYTKFTKKYLPKKNDIVMSRVGSYGNVGLIPTDESVCMGQNTVVIQPLINYRFLYYILLSKDAQNFIERNVGGGNQKTLSLKSIKMIPIPIPPLEVQREIVRILDNFTELTAELTAELSARRKQYSYYRDRLFSFDKDEVEWKRLGEVSNIYDSLHQTPEYSDTGYSMVRVADIKGGYVDLDKTLKVSSTTYTKFTKKYLPKKNDIVMSRVGSYGNVGLIPTDESVCMGQNTVVIQPLINYRFLYYILLSKDAQNFIERNVGGGNQKTLSLKSIKMIPIPIPSLEKQKEIVAILDKFDTLTNSISEGLPHEIELRQKQYEYYRDLLLDFPKEKSCA